jgi:hypothetical protein
MAVPLHSKFPLPDVSRSEVQRMLAEWLMEHGDSVVYISEGRLYDPSRYYIPQKTPRRYDPEGLAVSCFLHFGFVDYQTDMMTCGVRVKLNQRGIAAIDS